MAVEDYKRATLLDAYYNRVAGSLAAQNACPQIVFFSFGHGYVDETVDPPALQAPPSDLAATPNEFFRAEAEVIAVDGRVLVKCFFPEGSVSEPKKYSLTTLHDMDGTPIAVMQDLPDWLTPSDEHTVYGYLDFPTLGPNAPTVI